MTDRIRRENPGAGRQLLPTGRGEGRRRRRHVPLAALAAEVVGGSVAAAVPLHRLDPRLVNGAALAEIVAFGLLLLTRSGAALGPLVVASAAYASLHLSDQRAVLAVQAYGGATVLGAGRHGRPVAVRAGLRAPPTLPEPAGLAVPVVLDGARWWVDRAAFSLLVQARRATAPR